MFIRINSTDHTDMLINPQRITSVAEKNDGCVIRFDNGNYILTTASFEDVVSAIEQAVSLSAN